MELLVKICLKGYLTFKLTNKVVLIPELKRSFDRL
jgi:hypothetical protein